ncbi:uncharacterized protein KY384_002675 [Bacidia gigantensis]|uniref:uncharacterized protein n=1 Tax=Bacidia gigantensis TaxID=2732470 RepID=UPI001D03DA5D|nr:uncharacterized protein KY384_002675 [Bacidia gigantensis]KAG8532797.1 hypothetical protein KY384_002675 [Bacidia gigantensis]
MLHRNLIPGKRPLSVRPSHVNAAGSYLIDFGAEEDDIMSEESIRMRFFGYRLRVMRSSLMEARITQFATQHAHVVPGCEYARNDLALYLGPLPFPPIANDRLLHLIKNNRRAKVLILMDTKSVEAYLASRDGHVYYEFHMTAEQTSSCQILLIGSSQDPDFIAFIPKHLIWPRRARKDCVFQSLRIDVKDRFEPVPAFPPEMEPFLIPMTSLQVAIANMEAHIEDPGKKWMLPHSGVELKWPKPPPRHSVKEIQPEAEAHRKAMDDMVLPIHEAFTKAGTVLKAALPGLYPIAGDLKLIDDRAGRAEAILVELKDSHCDMEDDSHQSHVSLRHKSWALFNPNSLIFTFRAPWHCIITQISGSDGKSLCIPRKRIPPWWWNNHTSKWLSWDIDRSLFNQLTIDINRPDDLVQTMESLYSSNEFEWRDIPMAPLPLPDYKVSDPQQKSYKGHVETDVWESLMRELLMEMCRNARLHYA